LRRHDVIVVGAGLAGLAAAARLKDAGRRVMPPVLLDDEGRPAEPISGVRVGDVIRIDYGGLWANLTRRTWDHVAVLWEDRSDPLGPSKGAPTASWTASISSSTWATRASSWRSASRPRPASASSAGTRRSSASASRARLRGMSPKDLDPNVWILFDQYVHGSIDRRGFLEGVGKYLVGGMTAMGVLGMLQPDFARAQNVAPDDKRLKVKAVRLAPELGGNLARPAKAGKLPGVMVIHENRGLNPHIMDVNRRMALEGYVALAPDALTPAGGYPGDEDKAREAFGKLDQEKTRGAFVKAVGWLEKQPDCTGKVGAVGFCWGGGLASFLATQLPTLGAAVCFYGGAPPEAEVAKIKAPLLVHYAEKDDRINAQRPAFEAALKAAGVKYEMFAYPGTQHGFHNDTTPRYDEAAAKLAWTRTLAFFKAHLR
jgi:carboxymethylenebutenolidase